MNNLTYLNYVESSSCHDNHQILKDPIRNLILNRVQEH